MITDSHAHLFWDSYGDDLEAVLARARAAGVERVIVIGTDLRTSRATIELAASELELYPTAGIHPHDADGACASSRAQIEELCRLPECVAVGETGLDFFKDYAPRTQQLDCFHWQLDLARRLDKPAVIHCRDAHQETARAVASFAGVRGVMHCYTYGPDELEPYLEAGLMVSFSGVLTYPRNEANHAAAALVPEDRLLVETDCPFLAPQSRRGRRNEPSYVREVLECLAELRGVGLEELARITSDNAARLFGLAPLGMDAG